MLTKLIQRQLIAFAIVGLLAMSLLGVAYLEIPESFGVGRFGVDVRMAQAGGLYPNAPVTYRGVQVGKVADVRLTPSGTIATLSLEDGSDVPATARAEVRNGSVIGEPFLNLVTESGDGVRNLHDGDVIPASRVSYPVPTADFLTAVTRFVGSVPADDMRTTLHEAATALQSADALPSIIDSSTALMNDATTNKRQTFGLIDNAAKVLQTQNALQAEIRSSAVNLADFSGALADADDDLRTVLAEGGPVAVDATVLVRALMPTLPGLALDVDRFARVLNVYRPSLRHLLIVFPATLEAQATVQRYYPDQDYGEAGLSFKLTVNDPPVCYDGFPEAFKQRNPEDLTPRPLPANSYCKVASSDPRIVRGARNMPCPQDPDKRGARAQDCGLIFHRAELGDQ